MGAAVPQVITSDRASTAQVIDGSLKFDQSKSQHLIRTFTGGNRRTWTHSSWVRQGDFGRKKSFFMVGPSSGLSNSNYLSLDFDDNDKLRYAGGAENFKVTSQVFRDTGWYHVVWTCDTTEAAAVDRTKIYVNGELITVWSTSSSNPTQNFELPYNENSIVHRIGTSTPYNNDREWNDAMSQVYFIDGAALGPENFGFTDPLTNTWKPKKYKHDKRFYGVTFSNQLSPSDGPWRNSNPKSNGFDGSAATQIALDTLQGTLTFSPNFGQGPFEIEYRGFNDGQTTVTIDGTTLTYSGSNSIWTGTVGSFNTMTMVAQSGNRPGITYIKVNGYMLVDAAADNSFYLPFDGSAPIGEDRIGNGNNWTPVNFGGSVALDNPIVSGARPILNTTQGGTAAGVGVFGSKQNVGYAVTVYDDGGGNKYYIDGVKQATLTGLIRGATYTFDTSDSTIGSTHPFRLSATSAHGTEYTNGVAAITGAATTITIPYDAPNTLYYYCTSHSGMGSSITGITTNEKLADQYASNCTLALPLVGDDDDICASIACTARNKTATNSSVNPSNAVDKPHSNFYNGSHHWSANSDTLQYAQQGDELVFGTNDFTIECWLYDDNGHNGGGSGRCYIFDNRIGGSVVGDPPTMTGWVDGHNEFTFYDGDSEITHTVGTTVGKWWHYAVTREGTTTRMFIDGILRGSSTSSTNFTNNGIGVGRATDGGYGWAGYIQDFRVYKGIAKYTSDFVVPATSPDILPDTPSGVSGSSKLAKITNGSVVFDGTNDSVSIADHADFTFGSGDFTLEAYAYLDYATGYRSLAQKYGGDPPSSSWFWSFNDGQQVFYYYSGSNEPNMTSPIKQYNRWVHCAVAREGNTIRMFDDGKLTGTLDVSSYTSMNDSTVPVDIGADYADNYDFNGFISNVRIVKGTALYTKNFTPPTAPLTNVTNTKLLCCQSPTSAIEAAVSPSTPSVVNDAAATTFNPFNTDINTVRGQETGYMTINPLSIPGQSVTLSNGNFDMAGAGTNVARTGTIAIPFSGKYYWEITCTSGGSGVWLLGINGDASSQAKRLVYVSDARKYTDTGGGFSSYGASFTTGDVIGVAVDMDTDTLAFYKNGVSQGSAFTSISSGYTNIYPYFQTEQSGRSLSLNSGQKPFKFSPPDGFQPLNAANTRPVKVISRPDQYVGVTTYVGTGNGTTYADTSLKFKPDMTWFKRRDGTVNHVLYDSVRGYGNASNAIRPNTTGGESAFGDAVVTAKDNGFSVTGSNTTGINGSGEDIVCWAWKAGGNKNTFNVDDVGYASAAAAGLTGGDITPTGASVGTKQGFSIIKWESIDWAGNANNRQVPHGLTQSPDFIVTKGMENAAGWYTYHKDLHATDPNDYYLTLNTTDAVSNLADSWGPNKPDATTFGDRVLGWTGGQDVIAYLWHDVPGLQKFGTYVGNGNADGPFVELGFRPAVVLRKSTGGGSGYDWVIIDSVRDPDNIANTKLYPQSNGAENVNSDNSDSGDNSAIDILSNGFKVRASNGRMNASGTTFIYAAWAEAPSVDLFGGGANAR